MGVFKRRKQEQGTAPGLPYSNCQRPEFLNLWGATPGMDLGPKFVPKLRVLWFFGPERPQEPPLSVETPGDCADGPKREFGVGTAPGGSQWRPGRLPVASGTLPGMDLGPKFVPTPGVAPHKLRNLGPKFVPKQWVL